MGQWGLASSRERASGGEELVRRRQEAMGNSPTNPWHAPSHRR